jgi:hypothetical protein
MKFGEMALNFVEFSEVKFLFHYHLSFAIVEITSQLLPLQSYISLPFLASIGQEG